MADGPQRPETPMAFLYCKGQAEAQPPGATGLAVAAEPAWSLTYQDAESARECAGTGFSFAEGGPLAPV
jgi:hypothetical protein